MLTYGKNSSEVGIQMITKHGGKIFVTMLGELCLLLELKSFSAAPLHFNSHKPYVCQI